ERAGVSVAWIYDFFEDRQAIYDAIIVEGSRRMLALTRAAMLDALQDGWRQAVRAALDVNIAFKAREPAFVALWDSPFRSAEALHAHELNDSDQAHWIYDEVIRLGLMVPGDATRVAVDLAVSLADRGLEFSHNNRDGHDALVLDRLHAALVAILEPFSPTPPD
ncbi:MAG TPA: TetR/AcrR family transcriptional regulator, partial [Acidimicrobiales bacterium]